MENIKNILELDISDKKKAKLIASYLDKLEYPNVTYTYPYVWSPWEITYGPVICESTTGIETTISYNWYGISTE